VASFERRESAAWGGGRASHTLWQAVTLAVFFFAYLAIVHYPNSFCGIVRFCFLQRPKPGIVDISGSLDIAASYAYIALPALVLFLAFVTTHERARVLLALAAKILAGIAIFIAILDLLFAPFLAGPGGYVVFLIAASVLTWHLLVFGCATRVCRSGSAITSTRLIPIILLFGAPMVALMAWSLFAAVSATLNAHQIASGRPYCVARTEDGVLGLGNFGYGPLRSFEGLRGTRLFTTFTGYKDTSQWWFHAVLIVDGKHGREYWNWSISRMRFEPFHNPDRFVKRPTYACQPAPSFLARTPWL
jgi:hypothetical protein